jgi:hypothetical protein
MAKSAGDLCFGLAVGEREWSEGGAEQSRSGMTRANSQTEARTFVRLASRDERTRREAIGPERC